MQSIRSTGTSFEKIIAKELRNRKIFFTKHAKSIIGKPDFVFKRKKIAVFIDSDFWHGNIGRCIIPKTNIEYWTRKIDNNRARDQYVNAQLLNEGWIVIRIWESDLKINFSHYFSFILEAVG